MVFSYKEECLHKFYFLNNSSECTIEHIGKFYRLSKIRSGEGNYPVDVSMDKTTTFNGHSWV